MPNEPNGNETPVSIPARRASSSERTEARFLEDVEKIIADANNAVITAQANSNTARETLDKLAYTNADSLLNACISAKTYIKSKYKTTGQPYKNIAKTRFELPSRLRRK
jgi:hypothetical protein